MTIILILPYLKRKKEMPTKPTLRDDAEQIVDTYGMNVCSETIYEWANEFLVDYSDLQDEVYKVIRERKEAEA